MAQRATLAANSRTTILQVGDLVSIGGGAGSTSGSLIIEASVDHD